jgi:DNA-directed RNA polymerase specialized sigma24 family protein
MQTETVLDLRYNIAAMYIAILKEDIATPEQAFAIISNSVYRLTDEDTQDMMKMTGQGMKFEEVGQIYGITKGCVSKRIQRHKKDLSSGNLKRSVIK